MDPGDPRTEPRALRKLRPDDGRLVRGRRSRERIREAARDLFREVGFDRATLRAIGARAQMGASSIYRHVRSKEELLVDELAGLQEEAWLRFRSGDDKKLPTRDRIRRWLDFQHGLFAEDPDLTLVALRATTYPEARVARSVLALQDRTIGLVAEVLLGGRMRGELRRDLDVLAAARVLVQATLGARIAWVNGQIDADECRAQIGSAVEILFRGLEAAVPPNRGQA